MRLLLLALAVAQTSQWNRPPGLFAPRRSELVLRTAQAFLPAQAPDELLAAAAKGDVRRIEALLRQGADVESVDKNGRTPLMLAAQRGHIDAVKALLAAGAKPAARDRGGLNAYAIALLEPAGHGDREAVLAALPKPPRFRLAAVAGWAASGLVSSCFEPRDALLQRVGLLEPDESLLRELQAFIRSSGRGVAGLVSVDGRNVQPLAAPPNAAANFDATLLLEFEPGSACTGARDALTFDIDVRVMRAGDGAVLAHKSIGGGFKNMKAIAIDNAAQYGPVFDAWLKQQAAPVYWAAVEALLRAA